MCVGVLVLGKSIDRNHIVDYYYLDIIIDNVQSVLVCQLFYNSSVTSKLIIITKNISKYILFVIFKVIDTIAHCVTLCVCLCV